MTYYADYEALEFNSASAKSKGYFPYYLDINKEKTALCPLWLAISDKNGDIVESQDVRKRNISFLSFLDRQVWKLRRSKYKVIKISFHNLSYDFQIIIHELFYNGFKQIFTNEKIEYTGDYITEYPKSFEIIGQNLSKYVGVNIRYKGLEVIVRDTMSILNSSQDRILSDFGYDKKVDIEWSKITLDNIEKFLDVIKDRCEYDVKSLAVCIEEFKKAFSIHYRGQGMTAAGMSLDSYKTYIAMSQTDEKITKDIKEYYFRYRYPVLNKEHIELSKGCYSGGICTVNPAYQEKIVTNIQMLDINSSYPYSMSQEMPVGEPRRLKDFAKDGYSEYVLYLDFEFSGIPFIRCNSENRARRILGIEELEKGRCYTRSMLPKKFKGYLCINSIDLKLIQTYAKVKKCTFLQGVQYQTDYFLRDFIEPIYEEKSRSKGVKKMATKLLLNSLYGKFAQDLSGICFNYISLEEYNKVLAVDTDSIYKPLASAVTAYSRKWLVDMIYKLGKNFIYSDTDSVYFLYNPETIKLFEDSKDIDANRLGKWAYEYAEPLRRGKFLSKKNYLVEKSDGTLKLTCVGLSARYHSQINFDNFQIDSVPFTIEKMVNIYGGKAMKETEFRIKRRT